MWENEKMCVLAKLHSYVALDTPIFEKFDPFPTHMSIWFLGLALLIAAQPHFLNDPPTPRFASKHGIVYAICH